MNASGKTKQKTLFQSWNRCQDEGNSESNNISIQRPVHTSLHTIQSNTKKDDQTVIDLCFSDEDDEMLSAVLDESMANAGHQSKTNGQKNHPIVAEPGTCIGFDRDAGDIWIYPTNYPKRDYQFNIVRNALFTNTLVSLPTGLGKTFIAAVVMYNFYRWYPMGKIVFMAPTKPLVAQQIEACYNIMAIPQDDTVEMTGSLPPRERAIAWNTKRVFFLTPQVLMNDLGRGSCVADLVRCLVVDEAHKALSNHAYCQVIRELSKYKSDFRVIALSATPGSDIKSVQQVLHNLLISHIELRTENAIDIRAYIQQRTVEKIVVPLGEELTRIKEQYIRILTVYASRLINKNVLFNRPITSLSKFMILKSRDEFRQNPPNHIQSSNYGVIEGEFALCMSLYHGYELLQLHGTMSLYNFMLTIVAGEKHYKRMKVELGRNADFVALFDLLQQKYSDTVSETLHPASTQAYHLPATCSLTQSTQQTSHPKMDKLVDIVIDHFTNYHNGCGQEEQTRVIIFCEYRDCVNEITRLINRHTPLVKAMSFIGQSCAGRVAKGYTQKEQLKVMKRFREGGYNTLVSTCVGEEGLDIGHVDLIVCFDAHKSPIRLVQRMGRTGRKRKGRIVMLVTQGKEEQIYNQSQYNKKSINKAILNGTKNLKLFPFSKRMVPADVTPKCHHMNITISESFDMAKRSRVAKQTKPMKPTKRSKLSSVLKQGGLNNDANVQETPSLIHDGDIVTDGVINGEFSEKQAQDERVGASGSSRGGDQVFTVPDCTVKRSKKRKRTSSSKVVIEVCNNDDDDDFVDENSVVLKRKDKNNESVIVASEVTEKKKTDVENSDVNSKKSNLKNYFQTVKQYRFSKLIDLPPDFRELENVCSAMSELSRVDVSKIVSLWFEDWDVKLGITQKVFSLRYIAERANTTGDKLVRTEKHPSMSHNVGEDHNSGGLLCSKTLSQDVDDCTEGINNAGEQEASCAIIAEDDGFKSNIDDREVHLSKRKPLFKISPKRLFTTFAVHGQKENETQYNATELEWQRDSTNCNEIQRNTTDLDERQGHISEHDERQGITTDLDERQGHISEHDERRGITTDLDERHGHIYEHDERRGITTDLDERQGHISEHDERQGITTDLDDKRANTTKHNEKQIQKKGCPTTVHKSTNESFIPFSHYNSDTAAESSINEKFNGGSILTSQLVNLSDSLLDDKEDMFILAAIDTPVYNDKKKAFVLRDSTNKRRSGVGSLTPRLNESVLTSQLTFTQALAELDESLNMNLGGMKRPRSLTKLKYDRHANLADTSFELGEDWSDNSGRYTKLNVSHKNNNQFETDNCRIESSGVNTAVNVYDDVTNCDDIHQTSSELVRVENSEIVLDSVPQVWTDSEDSGDVEQPNFDLMFDLGDLGDDIIPTSPKSTQPFSSFSNRAVIRGSSGNTSQQSSQNLSVLNLEKLSKVLGTSRKICNKGNERVTTESNNAHETGVNISKGNGSCTDRDSAEILKVNDEPKSLNDQKIQSIVNNSRKTKRVDDGSDDGHIDWTTKYKDDIIGNEDDFHSWISTFQCHDARQSTPNRKINLLGESRKSEKGIVAITPTQALVSEGGVSSSNVDDDDDDDDVVVGVVRKKSAFVLSQESPTPTKNRASQIQTMVATEPGEGGWRSERQLTSSPPQPSDDDFQDASADQSYRKTKPLQKQGKTKKIKRTRTAFVDDEADESEEDRRMSSDEQDDSDLDQLDGSFIDDASQCTQMTQADDMQAVYLRSVRAAGVMTGRYKLQYNHRHTDVFSQVPRGEGGGGEGGGGEGGGGEGDEDEDEYQQDSFCCDDDDSLEEGTTIEQSFEDPSYMEDCERRPKRKRILECDISRDDGRNEMSERCEISSDDGAASDGGEGGIAECQTVNGESSGSVVKSAAECSRSMVLDKTGESYAVVKGYTVQNSRPHDGRRTDKWVDCHGDSVAMVTGQRNSETNADFPRDIHKESCDRAGFKVPRGVVKPLVVQDERENKRHKWNETGDTSGHVTLCGIVKPLVVQDERENKRQKWNETGDTSGHVTLCGVVKPLDVQDERENKRQKLNESSDTTLCGSQIQPRSPLSDRDKRLARQRQLQEEFRKRRQSSMLSSSLNTTSLQTNTTTLNDIVGNSQTNYSPKNGVLPEASKISPQSKTGNIFTNSQPTSTTADNPVSTKHTPSRRSERNLLINSSHHQTTSSTDLVASNSQTTSRREETPYEYGRSTVVRKRVNEKGSVFVDSREISGAQDIISGLRLKHELSLHVTQLTGCDYIVSNRLAVERFLWSFFANGSNRSKVLERVRVMCETYERQAIIVEKDRPKKDAKTPSKQQMTKYVALTLTQLSQTTVSVFFTDNQDETCTLLSELCATEKRKGHVVGVSPDLPPHRQQMLRTLLSAPRLSYITALNLLSHSTCLTDIINSSREVLAERGATTHHRAALLYSYMHRNFKL